MSSGTVTTRLLRYVPRMALPGSTKSLEILLSAALTALGCAFGFYLLGARDHVHRKEFERYQEQLAPIIRQIDESRGAVTARLAAVDFRLAELSELIRELRRER